MSKGGQVLFRIIHFNDSYNITPLSGQFVCGGIDRFMTKYTSFPEPKLNLFSGDLWGPSRRTND